MIEMKEAENKLIDESERPNREKRRKEMEKKKEDERVRVYNADKAVYLKLKVDIDDNKLKEDQISPFFSDKMPIFKYMDEKGMLNKQDEADVYRDLFTKLYGEDYKARKKFSSQFDYIFDAETHHDKDVVTKKTLIDKEMTKIIEHAVDPTESLESIMKQLDDEEEPVKPSRPPPQVTGNLIDVPEVESFE